MNHLLNSVIHSTWPYQLSSDDLLQLRNLNTSIFEFSRKTKMTTPESVEEALKVSGKKSFAGIPEATFVEDVDSFMKDCEGVEAVLRQLDETHGKYKFMELNLLARKKKLKSQIPDIQKSLDMIAVLEAKKEASESIETRFLLSDLLYSRAVIEPTDKVCLWLGANVMLEYSLGDAKALLKKNHETATKNLAQVHHDLDFLRDQMTTTEVNMARLYNWDVKRRQAQNAK